MPISSRHRYMLNLLHKTEEFLAGMRWKSLFFLHKYIRGKENMEKIQFTIRRYPPTIEELPEFEKDMLGVIDKIKFRKIKNNFQKQLSTEVKKKNFFKLQKY